MMKKLFLTLVISTGLFTLAQAQKYYTKSGRIDFFSKAPMEDIDARNKTVAALLDAKTGDLQFVVLLKSFDFDKALMQEHFNSDYVESDKFPRAEFKGAITNNSAINYQKEGTYTAQVKGKLTLHGVTRDVSTTATLHVTGANIDAASTFNILLSDYKISIPSVVKEKISRTVKIVVDTHLEPLK